MRQTGVARNTEGPVVHIGYPKCASTFLQKKLFPALEGWIYFDRVVSEPAAFLRRLRYEDFTKGGADLGAVEPAWRGNVIFSREHVLGSWGRGETTALSNLAYLGKSFGAEPTLLVLVRRQDSWVFSEFKFKHRSYQRPDNVIEHVRPVFLDYAALDLLLREKLGFSRIVYYPFERLVAESDGFHQFATAIFGVTLDAGFDVKSRMNESPRLDIAGFQFAAVQFLSYRLPILARLLPMKDITIPQWKRDEILDRYRSSNATFSKRNGLDLEQYGYF
jgi:hypothetical protein